MIFFHFDNLTSEQFLLLHLGVFKNSQIWENLRVFKN